jgi:hypothetical protein
LFVTAFTFKAEDGPIHEALRVVFQKNYPKQQEVQAA